MKKSLNNQHYFKISMENPEGILDEFYVFDEKHPQLEKYVSNTKDIKNLLITIKTLKERGEDKATTKKYLIELSNILNKFSNCSEFGCFINACDSFLDFAKTDLNLLGKIADKYFEKRILNESIPEEWIQAILDSNSSRKKSKCGEEKLIYILKHNGFQEIKKWNDFFKKEKCVAKFSKNFSVKNIRRKLNIKLSTKKQNKNLDLIIKSGDKIFMCEAKHLNTSGGGQDKQISELIEIVNLRENNKNIYYIAFLDGIYSNVLLNSADGGSKLKQQQNEIKKYLSINYNNFWVNTAGFKQLASDI